MQVLNRRQSSALVCWVNSVLGDVEEIEDPFQLLEEDGRRFISLLGVVCAKSLEPASPQNLDDAIRWLSRIKLMDGLSLTDFEGTSEQAFLLLLWNIVERFVLVPCFDSECEGKDTEINLKDLSAKAIKWVFSFAGPFVPRVLDQMKADLSIIYDGKLLHALVNRGAKILHFYQVCNINIIFPDVH